MILAAIAAFAAGYYLPALERIIRQFTQMASEAQSVGHKERADKEQALLETFVSGIAVAREE